MKLFKKEKGFLLSLLGAEACVDAIVANNIDASKEKHVPVVSVTGNTVTVCVGSVTHPMEEKHYIEMIIIETTNGFQVKYLKPGEEPKATFTLNDCELVSVYEYCNLHGLWQN